MVLENLRIDEIGQGGWTHHPAWLGSKEVIEVRVDQFPNSAANALHAGQLPKSRFAGRRLCSSLLHRLPQVRFYMFKYPRRKFFILLGESVKGLFQLRTVWSCNRVAEPK